MKRRTLVILRYIAIVILAFAIGLVVATSVTKSAEKQLEEVDAFIEAHTTAATIEDEPETVKLSYSEWKEQQVEEPTEPDIYQMDVWTLGSYLYGISELDTTRSLILISYEGYGPDSPLSYYVACACWARSSDGSDNLYAEFGGMDPQYDLWMDELGWDDYAIDALRECYLNPMYITGCNGMDSPTEWIYEEDGIYVW